MLKLYRLRFVFLFLFQFVLEPHLKRSRILILVDETFDRCIPEQIEHILLLANSFSCLLFVTDSAKLKFSAFFLSRYRYNFPILSAQMQCTSTRNYTNFPLEINLYGINEAAAAAVAERNRKSVENRLKNHK